jgi:hypothetical protein
VDDTASIAEMGLPHGHIHEVLGEERHADTTMA